MKSSGIGPRAVPHLADPAGFLVAIFAWLLGWVEA